MAKMVTSIIIEEELWREAKVFCIRKGITLGGFLEGLIREALKKADGEPEPAKMTSS